MISWRQRVRNLEEENRFLREKIKQLEHLLKSYENPHTPSSKKRKKNTKRDKTKPRFPGKPPGSGGGGIKLPSADEVKEHTLDACPCCNGRLEKTGVRKHTIIDLPEKPILTTEHQIGRYYCKACDKNIEAQAELPSGIYGPRLQSMVAMLKNLTNSHDKIANFIRELGAPSFSSVQVQNIATRFIEKLRSKRIAYLTQLRRENYVHADETGFRKDGRNGWVWGVFTQAIAIFSAQMSRARVQIQKLLPNYHGIVVRDGFSAYAHFKHTQRCWCHLLREFKDYAKKNDEIKVQYERIKSLYEQLKELNKKPPNEEAIADSKWKLNDIVTCLNAIKQGRKLATLVQNGGDDWFTALYHQDVPLDNNHAERELRSVVLLRKAIGCYRNQKGKGWIDVVMSVIHTWRLQGMNVFKQLCAVV